MARATRRYRWELILVPRISGGISKIAATVVVMISRSNCNQP
jgi:hypothetical protein